jgi:hypothetical protein
MIDGVWKPVAVWPLQWEADSAAMVVLLKLASRHK